MNPENFSLTYRIANLNDSISVSNLASETFRESWTEEGNEADVNQYLSENFTAEHISKELADKNITYLLAFNNNEPIAYLKLERNLMPDNYQLEKPISISRVYVRKLYQGKQIGSVLLDQAIAIAKKEDYKTIWLGVWNQNYNALQLYERFGFERFGIYQFVMGSALSDDYLMMKKI